jgi:peptidoglycan/LPS O-acetylase OafA/YrhL
MWKPEYELYFFTYFQNWYFFKIGNFDSHFSHLWSLGVEEQFYLIWPFLIIFLQKKALPFLFSFLILLAVFANAFYHKVPLFRNLTFSNFHTLGIGALFAYYHIEKPKWKLFEAIIQYKTIFALIALVFFIGLLNLHLPINTFFLEILKESLLAIVCLALLLLSIYGWVAPFSILTRSKIVKYIGKISYGIYLFHLPLPALYVLICTRIGIEYAIPTSVITSFILYTVLSIIAASISYHFFELKFLRIKNRFQ